MGVQVRRLVFRCMPLCRYITRPAVSEKRLPLTNQGKVWYELKVRKRNGTTHVIFEPVDFNQTGRPGSQIPGESDPLTQRVCFIVF
jgi:hypothetical protein